MLMPLAATPLVSDGQLIWYLFWGIIAAVAVGVAVGWFMGRGAAAVDAQRSLIDTLYASNEALKRQMNQPLATVYQMPTRRFGSTVYQGGSRGAGQTAVTHALSARPHSPGHASVTDYIG